MASIASFFFLARLSNHLLFWFLLLIMHSLLPDLTCLAERVAFRLNIQTTFFVVLVANCVPFT